MMKAWRMVSAIVLTLLVRVSIAPTKKVKPDAAANTSQSGLSTIISTAAGSTIATDKVVNKMPFTKKIGRKSSNNPSTGCLLILLHPQSASHSPTIASFSLRNQRIGTNAPEPENY